MDTKGSQELKDLAKQLGGVTKNTKTMADGFKTLTSVFQGWVAFLGIREIVNLSDEMQNLGNRLNIITGSQEAAADAMLKLKNLANETKSSVSDTAEVFARLGSSLRAAHVGTDALIDITKTLQNSFRVSGSTSTETTATIIQLSQAFASGTLRGQELRSVMLQNATVAQLLRQRFGKNLAKDAEAGLISIVEVLKVLHKNQDQINADAEKLSATFGQTLTKAFNNTQYAIYQLNNNFKLSDKFAEFVDIVQEKIGLIVVAIGVLALTQIPLLIASVQKLGLALISLAAENPVVAVLSLIAVAIVATNKNLDDFINKINKLQLKFEELQLSFNNTFGLDSLNQKLYKFIGLQGIANGLSDASAKKAKDLENLRLKIATNDLPESTVFGSDSEAQFKNLIANLNKIQGQTGKVKKLKEILGELNTSFINGKISVEEYNSKLINFEVYKTTRQFEEGKFALDEFNLKMNELKRNTINREFAAGTLSLQQFKASLADTKVEDLNSKLHAGKISLAEYNVELSKVSEKFSAGSAFRSGAQSYVDSIGTVAQGVAGAITNAFTSLETHFTEFIKTGKFNFAQFTQAILDDLLKIIIRASIIKPLAEGLLNAGTAGGPGAGVNGTSGNYTGSSPTYAAKGGVFSNIHAFADGGVVSKRTNFGFGNGQRGVMGEAGPEAILPLTRGSGGALGVQASVTPVNINIVNNSSADIQSQEKTGPNGERMIEVLVVNKVRDGFANGNFDKIMQQAYGLKRKGS